VRPRALLTAAVLASSAGCGTQTWIFGDNGDAAVAAEASGFDAMPATDAASRFDAAASLDAEPHDDAMWGDDTGSEIGPRGEPDSSEDARWGPCTNNGDCVFPRVTLFCDLSSGPLSGNCVECQANSQCRQMNLNFCDLSKDRCVQCLDDGDCPFQGQVCTASRQCVYSCPDGGGCPSGTRCYAGYCQSCRSDNDCNSNNSTTPYCLYRCVACLTNRNCTMTSLPRCNPATNTCVRCLSSDDCFRQEQCDPVSHLCVD
jgi:hypothetical protein